jgi:hypothetical protein
MASAGECARRGDPDQVAESLSPNTAKKLAALRSVLKKAWKIGLMSRDAYERAVDIAPIRGERLKSGRDISAGELRSLFVSSLFYYS